MPEMPELVSQLVIGIVVFCSTNIDDILLLAAFFSDPHLHRHNVVTGQFVGIGALVGLSAIVALTALAIPPGWIALLGLVPLALGAKRLAALLNTDTLHEDGPHVAEQKAERLTHSQVLAVASVTVANGGDNLGVYIPLFVSQSSSVVTYALVFCAMTALWCWLGYRLVRNRWVGEWIQRYARTVVPLVLVGLGIYILSGARALL